MLNKAWDKATGMDRSCVVLATLLALFAALLPAPDPHCGVIHPGAILPVEVHSPRGALVRPPRALFWSTTQPGSRVRLLVSDHSGVHLIDRAIESADPREQFGQHGQYGQPKIELREAEVAALQQAQRWIMEVSLVSDEGELLATSGGIECWIGP